MTALNATCTRRAMTGLATPEAEPARGGATCAPESGPRLWLPVPADSRGTRAVLSTGARVEWQRALDLAALVAAATGLVALLAAVCR